MTPFVRLSDNYVQHPKFRSLSDGAFRLWHEGLALCRQFQTDGLITFEAARTLGAFTVRRAKELLTPHVAEASALWESHPTGYQVHDYLEWNLSRTEEEGERNSAAMRMRRLRAGRRLARGDDPAVFARTRGERSHDVWDERSPDVPDRNGSDRIGSGDLPERDQIGSERTDTQTRAPAREEGVRGNPQGADDAGFELFWNAYPVHRQINRAKALAAWEVLAPNTELLAQVMARLGAYCVSADWTRENGRFVPAPDKWLTDGRWKHEPTDVTAQAVSDLTRQNLANLRSLLAKRGLV